jgi:hypothetical protein
MMHLALKPQYTCQFLNDVGRREDCQRCNISWQTVPDTTLRKFFKLQMLTGEFIYFLTKPSIIMHQISSL